MEVSIVPCQHSDETEAALRSKFQENIETIKLRNKILKRLENINNEMRKILEKRAAKIKSKN